MFGIHQSCWETKGHHPFFCRTNPRDWNFSPLGIDVIVSARLSSRLIARWLHFATILYSSQKILLLNDGQIIQTNTKKETTTFSFEETQFDLEKYSTKTTKFPKIQELETAKLINCTNILLRNFEEVIGLEDLTCRKAFFDNLVQELFKRIYKPINIILLGLVASLLVLKSKNSSDYSVFKTKVFITGVLFLVIAEILLNFAGSNYLYNLIFILFPIFSYIGVYRYINLKIRFN